MRAIEVRGLSKSFTLHLQGGLRLPIHEALSFELNRGECLVLEGPSGAGKSSLLKALYGQCVIQQGAIRVYSQELSADPTEPCVVELRTAHPRTVDYLRRKSLGYVSQFLDVIPRVSARELVAEPYLKRFGRSEEHQAVALAKAEEMLTRLMIPRSLWDLPPATFSGGEQQRVNVARGFVADYPILLLDEPTAALDPENRQIVVDLISEAVARGTAVLAIFHDEAVRAQVATRRLVLEKRVPVA